MIRCRRVAARLDAYLDGELSDNDRRMVEQHLAACASCRRLHDELARQVGLIESLPRVAPSDALRHRIMTALPQRPTRLSPRPRASARRLAWAGAALMAMGAIIAAVWLAGRAPHETRVAPAPSQHEALAERPPAPLPLEEETPEETPAVEVVERPVERAAPSPRPTEPAETPEMLAQGYRDLAQEHEREGELYDALVSYEQADAAEEWEASVDVARVYEKMGYTAHAVDHYADLAFAPGGWDISSNNGG